MENKALNQFINEWKELSVNYYKDLFSIKHEISCSDFIANYGKGDYLLVDGYNIEMVTDMINKDAIQRKADFLKRISKKVGKIESVDLHMANNMEINGTAKGDKGEAKVSSIIAGGWNIQKAHYRVLVK